MAKAKAKKEPRLDITWVRSVSGDSDRQAHIATGIYNTAATTRCGLSFDRVTVREKLGDWPECDNCGKIVLRRLDR